MKKEIFKYLPFVVLAIITIALATFSIVGEAGDTSLYSNPFMIIGWCVLVVSASCLIFGKRKTMGIPTILIHLSFVIILIGALFSHFSETGFIHLREGETKEYAIKENHSVMRLPFSITLQKFEIEYYHLSDAPKDFVSYVETHGRASQSDSRASQSDTHRISMNNVLDVDGYRLFQMSYDEDGHGSFLTVTYDPVGTTITYFGYFLLALSMILFLFGRRSYFRQILRDPLWKTFTVVALMSIPTLSDASPRTFPAGPENSDVDEIFGKCHILYNGRIALIETYALDFTRKLTGKDSYGEFSATQVLAGWIFAPEDWRKEKMIKSEYGMIDFDSAVDTLRKGMMGKVMTKGFDELDEKIGLILDLQAGNPLMIFPRTYDSLHTWIPLNVLGTPSVFYEGGMKEFVEYVNGKWPADNFVPKYRGENKYDALWEIWYLLRLEQQDALFDESGCDSRREFDLKYQINTNVEHIYNRYGKTAPLAYASLTLGLLSFVCMLRRGIKRYKWWFIVPSTIIFIGISAIMAMRGIISGHFPMSNGYETMLFISWIAFAMTVVGGVKFPILIPAGFFIGGFALLVSKLGMMNPEITPLMPVLASPWMSIHVTLMMLSYTFFAFMAFNSAVTLVIMRKSKTDVNVEENESGDTALRLVLLNRFLLYPSTFMLAIGMFIGAVWANGSWGSYWSWDPKETWALITMIIYAMAFHRESISWMKRDIVFQTYLLVSFGAIIMTYFGVNYLLGGMHSYAG